jgi:hypothetical protein
MDELLPTRQASLPSRGKFSDSAEIAIFSCRFSVSRKIFSSCSFTVRIDLAPEAEATFFKFRFSKSDDFPGKRETRILFSNMHVFMSWLLPLPSSCTSVQGQHHSNVGGRLNY